ncbi:MAG: response regulator [Oceanicaulis sp.]
MNLDAVTARLGDHVRDAVAITQAEPIDEPGPRMVWVNDAFTRMTGYSRQEAIGQTPRILQGEDVDRVALGRIRAALKTWKPVREVLKNYTKSGEPFWVELDIKPITDAAGWHHYWVAVQRDVTSRVEQAEALRRARDDAQSANRLKSEFLANMSHEIRTPLNGVLGMAQVLAMTELDARQRRAVETILSSGQSLLGLIEDVLDLSRVEAGRILLEPEPVTATALIEAVGQAVRGVCLQKNLNLRVEPGDGADAPFFADPRRTRQILINLAGNAAKFTKAGEVVIAARRDAGRMIFEVRDTGPGVPPALRRSIFERFRQGDASLSRSHEGAGLGLAIARDLTALAGGELDVDDAPEGGAAFRLTLPFKPAGPEAGAAPSATVQASAGEPRALIVEDNAVNREVVEEALSLHGWRVAAEARADAALDRLAREQFDLVIMDREMPGMNGEDAIRTLRTMEPPVCDIPVLMLTAHAMNGAREAALAAGADDYMAKPVELDRLIETATRLAGREGD